MTHAQIDWLDQVAAQQRTAQQRLQRMVDERAQSFECQQFRRHRDAALKHTRTAA